MVGVIATTIPHGRTARRLDWAHLPPVVRTAIERRLGSRVVGSESQDAGYTPGFASVLVCADGSRHFVKAASLKAQRAIAEAYREESRNLPLLPPTVPAPRLQWVLDQDDWFALGIQYVESRPPHRPWVAEDLRAAADALVEAGRALTPAPGLGLSTFAEEFAAYPEYWSRLTHLPHHAEAAELAAGFAEVTAGDTLVHTDIRDDNILITPDGTASVCDWNWPVVGADWIDSLLLLIGPRGDGVDVEAVIADHPLLADVPAGSLDRLLALLTGFFLVSATATAPRTSPYLRTVQGWQGEVCWDWLCERRGWR
ncbi:phosphotransferase [Nocardioides insulae]|uniref:phosphotransferase n=1 Tax=Nocardioides insulae TaxID=394734 RepID=UPI0004263626|nr:phosphotransferase [Nocardioides insulae]